MRLRTMLPELEGATAWLNSGEIKRKDLVGSPILVHFWSISCDLCKRDMLVLNQICEQYLDHWRVISVHTPLSDEDKNQEEVRRVADEHEIYRPVLIDHEDRLSKIFRIRHVPAYYLFDGEGRLRHYQSGGGGLSLLRRRMDRLSGQ
ncbi:TlpA family protein disulfide reductase [Virgibacillus xinjiangensis]|uniref:TlpA family protein disulfide reductase n=1 Tax=Virgibacillus xinjiangensis TaxID=393090 RepID=A0ABV7CQT3_9BACI